MAQETIPTESNDDDPDHPTASTLLSSTSDFSRTPPPPLPEPQSTAMTDGPIPLQPPATDVIASEVTTVKQTVDQDVEKNQLPHTFLDIEHLQVDDDPRLWSNAKKNSVLA
jgi:hypothetical protein